MNTYCKIFINFLTFVLNFLHEAYIVTENSFLNWLSTRQILFFGDGAEKCKPILSAHQHAIFIDGIYASAEQIGLLGYQEFEQNKLVGIATFSPLYLKPFQSHTVTSSSQKD